MHCVKLIGKFCLDFCLWSCCTDFLNIRFDVRTLINFMELLLTVGLCFCYSLISGVFGQPCSTPQINLAVYEGTLDTMMTCGRTTNVTWQVFTSTDPLTTVTITSSGDTVNPSLTGLYGASQTGLTIKNATTTPGTNPIATAGLYVVKASSTVKRGGKLVVVHEGPSCTCNAINSTSLQINCSIKYADSSYQPIYAAMNWTSNGNFYTSNTPQRTSVDETWYVSTSTITVDANVPADYQCTQTFTPPDIGPAYVATNAPTFRASCTAFFCEVTTPPTTTTTTTTPPKTTTISPSATFNFLVDPAFGPIAGGTKVAVTDLWSELHGNISVVYFGSNLLSKNITRSENGFTVITPPTDASAVGQSLPISVGPFNVSTNKSFTYAPNPEVHDVNPKVITLSGGLRLTVTGSNLSSVAKPLIRVLVAVKRGDGSSSNNESFAPCESATEGGTQMICLSPPVYIPDDFLAVLFGSGRSPYTNAYRKRRTLLDSTKTNSRRKRQAEPELYTNRTYSGKNDLDKLSIFIGAVFDGYSEYSDDILRDNPSRFGIFFPPTFTCPDDSDYDPNTDDLIKIKGEGLSRCCNADSYTVHLGNDFCNVTKLTDNQLTCKPPKNKPKQTQSDIVFCDQNIAIFVNVGYRNYKCSCLKYTDSGVTKLIKIIVATVGSSLVFFIVIILASVIFKKVKNSKMTYHQDPQVDETRGRRGIVLRSWQSESDRPGLTSDDNSGDIQMGQDEYRSYINPSEGDSYRGASYNGGYARDIGGNDHQERHNISDDHDDYLERDDRGNWKEDSSKGRRTDNE